MHVGRFQSRLTAFARRGSVVTSRDVRDAAKDGYDWSRHGKPAVAAIDLVKTEGDSALLMHQLLGRTVVVPVNPETECCQMKAIPGI